MTRTYTPADVAELLGGGVTARKVLDWRKRYGWPCIEIGRTVRFTDEHVAAILAKHTTSARSEPQPIITGQTPLSAARNRRRRQP